MTLSLESLAAARIALAEKALVSKDPRYLAAYHELRKEMLRLTETERLIEASREPALLRAQI